MNYSKKTRTPNRQSLQLSRKLDHLQLTKELDDGPLSTGFEDVHLIHQAVSPLQLDEVDSGVTFCNKKLSVPFIINAMTGGPEISSHINACLARVAAELHMGMAVGSQALALNDPNAALTYTIARQENPHGLILANLSALASPDEALRAIEMLSADGLQLHLNAAHELAMAEGDRDFRRALDNIAAIVEKVPVPVIMKEVGFGLSVETARQLFAHGVAHFDVGGQGGTNFGTIERVRQKQAGPSVFELWGIPTAVSVAEVSSQGLPVTIIASGGIRSALDGVKAMALGADLIGIAGPVVKLLLDHTEAEVLNYFHRLIYDFRALMLLAGARSLEDLKKVPVVITGRTKDWLEQRGILDHYRQRTRIH
ncbi:MAG TPA: type 2 isopentenyl-diphosphate Delta-isomerase [Clostridia bacterium]|nr:type 2 isopentenyl-diphosphate Delta-isomerase [Clostridia bacterium]